MKVFELKRLIHEAVKKTLRENMEVSTDPSWFDSQSDHDLDSREPKRNNPESRKIIDLFKKRILNLHKTGKRLNKDSLSALVQDVEHHGLMPFDALWDLAHVAIEELQDTGLYESLERKPKKIGK